MREEIRLGNEALARNDIDTAARYFQQLLEAGGTELQERIALNRLRDIQARRMQAEAQQHPPPAKARPRRKAVSSTKQQSEDAEHRFVRPPDSPVVIIKRY